MSEKEIFDELSGKAPTGYKLNELIPFSYPVRRIKLDVLVNKQPDGSLVKVYTVILRAIQAGFQTQSELFEFLGLADTDEFITRELFVLREKGYINISSDKWVVLKPGEDFLNDNSVLRIEEEEEFEFLIDGISGALVSSQEFKIIKSPFEKFLKTEYSHGNRSVDLLEGKYQELADIYKSHHGGKAYLIEYSGNDIKYDSFKDGESGYWSNFWLLEYIPERNTNGEAWLEVRSYDDRLQLHKPLTEKFNSTYRERVYALNSERREIDLVLGYADVSAEEKPTSDFTILSIWETKQKLIEALQTVQEQILIESPWIKKATREYLPHFEKLLRENKQLIILYGIDGNDGHDEPTLKQVKELQQRYSRNFKLIHLPTHLQHRRMKMTGTHRKLLIKDNSFYISGSFNFLSFGKTEGQMVANEESILVTKNVEVKWEQVMREYRI